MSPKTRGGVSNTQQVPREDADIAEKSSPKPMRGRARGRPRGRPRGQSSHREVINDTGSNGIAEFLPQIRNDIYSVVETAVTAAMTAYTARGNSTQQNYRSHTRQGRNSRGLNKSHRVFTQHGVHQRGFKHQGFSHGGNNYRGIGRGGYRGGNYRGFIHRGNYYPRGNYRGGSYRRG